MTNLICKPIMELKIDVEVAIVKEDDYYVAYCPALELSAYADTSEKAKKAFEDEVKTFIDETNKRGTLEKYLLKNGWRLQQHPTLNYEPPIRDKSLLYGASFIRQQVAIPV